MSDDNDEQEITYSEILATAMLNSEVIITVITDEVEKIKVGLKNVKAKQIAKLKEDGLVPPSETLEFQEAPSLEGEEFTDLRIILRTRNAIKIKKLTIPDNNF